MSRWVLITDKLSKCFGTKKNTTIIKQQTTEYSVSVQDTWLSICYIHMQIMYIVLMLLLCIQKS